MAKDFVVDHYYGLMASDFLSDEEIESINTVEPVFDFDNTDNVQRYTILQNAKELLAYLNDSYESFPFDSYSTGVDALRSAMAFVDSLIHGEIE